METSTTNFSVNNWQEDAQYIAKNVVPLVVQLGATIKIYRLLLCLKLLSPPPYRPILRMILRTYRKVVHPRECIRTMQWRRKLENFEGDWDEKFGVLPPRKLIGFLPICLLPMYNLHFSWFFFSIFIFSPVFLPSRNFTGGGGTQLDLS